MGYTYIQSMRSSIDDPLNNMLNLRKIKKSAVIRSEFDAIFGIF